MGRKADSPTPKWNADAGVWEVRVTLPRPLHLKAGQPSPRKLVPLVHRTHPILEHEVERAARFAVLVTKEVRAGKAAPEEDEETVTTWSERWIEDREARAILSAKQDGGRLANHVLPTIGDLVMAKVSRDDVERLVEVLDGKVRAGELMPKTASNVWTLVTSMFDDACRSKTRAMRCRTDNPARDVRGPDRGVDRSPTYLYPSEFLRLISAPDHKVPVRFKILYAVALYTYARAGELEALEPDDVDLEHQILSITKAVDRRNGEVKSTKSGESRRIPIEPNLLPLLKVLHDRCTSDRFLWLPKAEERAVSLRDHLIAAGIDRADLFADNDRQRHLTFHDLRRTALTWLAVRGDDPLRIRQRAGHASFSTTEGYLVETETLARGFGEPFPALPQALLEGAADSGQDCGLVAKRNRVFPGVFVEQRGIEH